MNNIIDFDYLLERMQLLDPAAFDDFQDAVRDLVTDRLRASGLTEEEVQHDAPRHIMSLAVLIVQRSAEIEPGRVLEWLRIQTRNLVVRYWRESDQQASPAPLFTAGRTHQQLTKLDGQLANYSTVARQLGVPLGWLCSLHRRLLAHLEVEPTMRLQSPSQP